MVAIRPPMPPTPLEENEIGREYKSEKDVDEMTLKLNIYLIIENLTLVEDTQEDETQKVVNVEDGNIAQPKATTIGWNDLQSW
ncbi:unnamed protein product [Prunus armeniaca]|uniref:Uncharacterized protein n=1 Tax=Prunus armeniaca TaxID=36596 RepID=A0A6J5WLK4_PRUAR|nr:unnamed protein product [Prunus armeniaca]